MEFLRSLILFLSVGLSEWGCIANFICNRVHLKLQFKSVTGFLSDEELLAINKGITPKYSTKNALDDLSDEKAKATFDKEEILAKPTRLDFNHDQENKKSNDKSLEAKRGGPVTYIKKTSTALQVRMLNEFGSLSSWLNFGASPLRLKKE